MDRELAREIRYIELLDVVPRVPHVSKLAAQFISHRVVLRLEVGIGPCKLTLHESTFPCIAATTRFIPTAGETGSKSGNSLTTFEIS